MKKYLLFTGYDTDEEQGVLQGDYDTAREAFEELLLCHSRARPDDPFGRENGNPERYKIISFSENRILAEGLVKNLIELLSADARVGMELLLSPAPSG